MTCPTGKNGYHNKRAAGQARKKDEAKFGHRMRAYRCDLCGAWHLTKMTSKEYSHVMNMKGRPV